MSGDDFSLSAALNAAPSLNQSPSLALAAASDPTNPAGTAQSVGAAVEYNAAAEAIKQVKQSNHWYSPIVSAVSKGVSAVGDIPGVKSAASHAADWMSQPEKFVQHQYRYLHDVQARHGWGAALAELSQGIYGSGIAGSVGHAGYQESWDRTGDKGGEGYTDPNTHQKVSFGRDVTSLIPWLGDHGTRRFSISSGLLDAVFDTATDPTLRAGGLAKAAKTLDLTKTALPAAEDLSGLQKLRVGLASTITLKDPQSWDIAMQNGRVRSAVDKIVETQTPSDMRRLLPTATDGEIRDLVNATSREDVRQVYMDGLHTSNVLNRAPVLSLMSPISNRIRNVGVKDAEASTQLGQDIAGGVDTTELAQSTARRERMQRRFLTRLPLDADTTNPNPTRSFHLDSPNAGDVVHGIVKYSYDTKVADAVRDAYVATTDMTQKAVILGNAVKAAGWNMGFKDLDPKFWQTWSQDLDSHLLRGRDYGIDGETGHLLDGRISTPDRAGGAASTAAAIFSGQAGRAEIPHFNDIRKAIADAQVMQAADSKVKGVFSFLNPAGESGWGFKADDFLYHHITQPVFKRLALFSGGFALRIGIGEGLYQGLKDGVVPALRSQIGQTAAKLGYKVAAGERDSRLAAAIASGLHKMSPSEAETGIRLQLEHDGHILPPSIDAGHIAQDTIESKVSTYAHNYKKVAARTQPADLTSTYRSYQEGDNYFDFFYRKHLQDIAESPEAQALAQAYLRNGLDDTATIVDHAKMLQSKGGRQATRYLDRASDYALQNNGHYPGFAGQQLNALKGAITGADGTLNRDFLEQIAEGKTPSLGAINGLDRSAKPHNVPGLEVGANTDSSVARFFNAGHRRVISPIINSLSRNGSFIRLTDKHYQQALAQGVPDADAFRLAQQRAMHELAPDLHNPNIRTQFSELARNYVPFFFAQDQAYRRWARLAVKDPTSLRKIQLLHQAGVNTGFVHKDPSTGQETFMYPGSGFIGGGVKTILQHLGIHTLDGVPLSFSGNVSSLSTVTPFAEPPGVRLGGPVIGVPLASLEALAPESAPIVEAAKGEKGSGQGVWDMLIPNAAIKDVVLAYAGDHSRAFQSAQMQALQTVFYNRLNGMDEQQKEQFLSDPFAQQKLIDESKSYARTIYLLKAVLGEGLPTQPQAQIGNTGMRQEFAELLKTEPTVGDAVAAFQKKHPGEDLSPFSVFQSQTVAGGYVPATQEALDYFEQNKALLSKLPYGAAWLIPQKGADADAMKIYNEQIAIGLRKKRTPEEFLKQLYTAAGNQQYYALRDQKNEALAATADDPVKQQAIKDQWQRVTATLSQQNPVWASQQGDKTRAVARERALQDFSVLFDPANADRVPQNEQFGLVKQLYQVYLSYSAQRSQMVEQGFPSEQKKALDDQWQAYLDQTAKGVPQLSPVIQSVFKEVK